MEAFDSGVIDSVYLDNTYNLGLDMTVFGPGAVQVIEVRARQMSAGLTELSPLVGWGCDRFERVLFVASPDLRSAPRHRIWSLSDRAFTQADRYCPFLVARFIPTRKGVLHIRDFDITYRVGKRTHTFTLEYSLTLKVTREGLDSRTP